MIIDVPVTGTNYSKGVYEEWLSRGAAPSMLDLKRDPNNTHDPSAVMVIYKHSGKQLGWVGKTHSWRAASLLDNGYCLDGDIESVYHNPNRDPMQRLIIRLCLSPGPDTKPETETMPTTEGMHTVKVFGAVRSSRSLELLHSLPIGTVLDCDTIEARSSVTLLHKNHEVAWFRKREPGAALSQKLVNWANTGELCAVIAQQNPTQVTLHYTNCQPAIGTLTVISTHQTQPNKEPTMKNFPFLSNLFAVNTKAAGDAAVLEAGRLANNTITKLITDRLPFMARFFAKTPFGKLVVANAAVLLVQQLRPEDRRLANLTTAMATQAYQETYQLVDIEGAIEQLLSQGPIKRALDKLDTSNSSNGVGVSKV